MPSQISVAISLSRLCSSVTEQVRGRTPAWEDTFKRLIPSHCVSTICAWRCTILFTPIKTRIEKKYFHQNVHFNTSAKMSLLFYRQQRAPVSPLFHSVCVCFCHNESDFASGFPIFFERKQHFDGIEIFPFHLFSLRIEISFNTKEQHA